MSRHSLENVVDRAISTTGKNGVVSSINRFRRLTARFRWPARRQDFGLDSRTS